MPIYNFNTPINEPVVKEKKESILTKFNDVCVFCGKKTIHECLLARNIDEDEKTNFDLKFCDLICARLYDINIHKIEINYKAYRKAYNNGKLSKNSKFIYEKCKYKLFNELPIKKFDVDLSALSPNEKKMEIVKIKKDYYTILQ